MTALASAIALYLAAGTAAFAVMRRMEIAKATLLSLAVTALLWPITLGARLFDRAPADPSQWEEVE